MNNPKSSVIHSAVQPPVLVLGASSLVGPFLIERLSRAGRAGTCTGRRPPTDSGSLPPAFQWQRLDVADPAVWKVVPGTALLALRALRLLGPRLPHLAQAILVLQLGPACVLAKRGSARAAERYLARRLPES